MGEQVVQMMMKCPCDNWSCAKEVTELGRNQIFHFQCWKCDKEYKVMTEV